MIKKLIKRSLVIFFLALIVFSAGFFFVEKSDLFQKKDPTKIAWVTDIHADRFKRRDVDSGRIYPRQYKDYLPKVFEKLRQEVIYTVVATGDNTNSGDDNYARDILKIAEEKKMDMIWVIGNHDNEEIMSILGVKKNYYFRDIGKTRIIVLDTTEYPDGKYDYSGGISREQIDWIKESLKTEKEIIVAMHMPIFSDEKLLDRYSELEEIFAKSGKVKIVLSGHYHISWQKELNGVRYYGLSALTRDGEEGGHAIIDLTEYSLKYEFAK